MNILTIRMTSLKGCLVFSLNLHLGKCWTARFFIGKNFLLRKILGERSDEISRKSFHFYPVRDLMFDCPPRFLGKPKPQFQLQLFILFRFFPLSFAKSLLTVIFQNNITGFHLWWLPCKKKSRGEELSRRKKSW